MKKKVIVWVCSIAIVLLVLTSVLVFIGRMNEEVPALTFTGNVTIENGVASPAEEHRAFVVEKDGTYFWDYRWKAGEGMITGMCITAPDGEVVFVCTADWCYAQSVDMELATGTYDIAVTYLTNEEAYVQYLTEHGMEVSGTNAYAFAKNMTQSTEYTIRLEKANQLETGYKFGIVFGVAIGILLVIILLTLTKNGDKVKCQFDERQELVRGRGFKYGFFTIMISNTVLLILQVLEVSLFSNTEVTMLISIVLGVSVFASYCIWHDGYFALNENRRKLIVVFGVCGLMNIVISIANIWNGKIMQDGALTFYSSNIFCALLFVEIFSMLLIKHIKDGKEE